MNKYAKTLPLEIRERIVELAFEIKFKKAYKDGDWLDLVRLIFVFPRYTYFILKKMKLDLSEIFYNNKVFIHSHIYLLYDVVPLVRSSQFQLRVMTKEDHRIAETYTLHPLLFMLILTGRYNFFYERWDRCRNFPIYFPIDMDKAIYEKTLDNICDKQSYLRKLFAVEGCVSNDYLLKHKFFYTYELMLAFPEERRWKLMRRNPLNGEVVGPSKRQKIFAERNKQIGKKQIYAIRITTFGTLYPTKIYMYRG